MATQEARMILVGVSLATAITGMALAASKRGNVGSGFLSGGALPGIIVAMWSLL